MNTPNDAANAEDFEALYLAYKAKYEAVQKDAERYRWLRDSGNAYPLFFIAQRSPNNVVVQVIGDLADMNIDEMIRIHNGR